MSWASTSGWVKIVSKLQPRAKRFAYLEAKTIDLVGENVLGQWHTLEQFIIALQTRASVKDVQQKLGLPADSYPTTELLGRM